MVVEPAPRFQILGPLRVRGPDGAEVAITGARERALLTRLLVDVGASVSEGQLLEDLWPQAGPAARGSLQVRVSSLRRQLRGLAQVARVGHGYRLEVEPATVDAARFESLVERSAAELPADAVELLQEALTLWQEPPLAELEGTPAELLRSRFDVMAQEARVRLGRALAESGRP